MAKKNQPIPLEQAWINWKNCVNGDDQNAIFRQITTMIWDTAIFRVIMEGRKAKIQQNAQNPEFNVPLHLFIDRNYFQAQSATIRRLVDTSRYGLTGDRGVYSLGALIKDIRNYRNELTRKAFLDFRKMPYDYSEIQRKQSEYIRKHGFGNGFVQIPEEYNWEPIEETHRIFDRLCGVKPDQRSPNDQIDPQVFSRLLDRLVECQQITKYVDKFIAHSSIPESRLGFPERGITLSQLWTAQRILYEVAAFLNFILFFEYRMVLPHENSTFSEFFEKPLFEEDEIIIVHETLQNYREETDKWASGGIENTWNWIEDRSDGQDENKV